MINSFAHIVKGLPAVGIISILVVSAILFLIWKISELYIKNRHEIDKLKTQSDTENGTKRCDKHDDDIAQIKVDVAEMRTELRLHTEYQREYNDSTNIKIDKIDDRFDKLDSKINDLVVLFQNNSQTVKKKSKVLILDDDENILYPFSVTLERKGAYVDTAKTYYDAIAKSKAIDYTHYFIDYNLKDKFHNGVDFYQHVKANYPLASIKLYTGMPIEDLPKDLQPYYIPKEKIYDIDLI